MTGTAEITAPRSQRLDPKSFIVRGLLGLRNAVFPMVAAYVTLPDGIFGLAMTLVIGLSIIIVAGIRGYLVWRKFTYTVGEQDIRVDSGVVSRAARSVPYERIQDVSLEQALLPRMFGLVEVKLETGSGGGEDLKLTYLPEAEGERLREIVRDRREGAPATAAEADDRSAKPVANADPAEVLFAMDTPRLLKFGLFEFSLAVVALFFGATQQFDFLLPFEIWDFDAWRHELAGPGQYLAGLGFAAQVVGGVIAVLTLVAVGFGTGVIRTFAREWGFVLEKTARGFRRRRGLFTKTDVVMPVHRVQAVKIGTKFLRYRFGWRGLSFVSLAQDAGSSNHVVAPFAQIEEIAPIIRAAGFAPPADDLEWMRASKRYRFDGAFFDASLFVLAAVPVAIFAPVGFALIPLAIAGISAAANLYGWRFHRHAIDGEQVLSTKGYLSPSTQIAKRVKLHSVEIAQGPIAQRRGYATLNLGLAGGDFAIPGIPLARAKELRCAIIASIAAKDFSELA